MQDLVEVGFVARPHGVRGELRIALHDPESTTLAAAPVVYVGGEPRRVVAARPVPGAFLLRLEGVDGREIAETLRGAAVCVRRQDVPLAAGQYLLSDLVGCRVELADGRPWGKVAAIEVGPQDRLVIHDGDVERLLPVVPELVVEVDIAAGRVVVDPPAGLPESRRR